MLHSSGFEASEPRLGLVAFDVSGRNVPVLVTVTHSKSAGHAFASYETTSSDGCDGDMVKDDPGAKIHLSENGLTVEFSPAKSSTATIVLGDRTRISVPLFVLPGI